MLCGAALFRSLPLGLESVPRNCLELWEIQSRFAFDAFSRRSGRTAGQFCIGGEAAVLRVLKYIKYGFAALRGLARYSYLLENLVKKDFSLKYRRSFLGILWSVLNPLLMMAVITAVFVNVFRFDIKEFPIYYLSGSLVFNFMSGATSNALSSILNASSLIKKVYIPKYIFPIEKCLFELVNTLFSFIAVLAMMPILGIVPRWTIMLFWLPLLYTLVFSAGFGMILSAVNVFFRDIGHLYSVWITAWMYLTPVLYPATALPAPMQKAMLLNPMYHFVEYFRNVVVYGILPAWADTRACIIWAFATLIAGMLVFKRLQDRFILHI
jgi:ABC-2 type transport system permease protein